MDQQPAAGVRYARRRRIRDPVTAVRAAARALPAFDHTAFAASCDAFADARVVLIGEGTHGTHEFYRARELITRRLVERHGFNIVAAEADWPDADVLDRYVRLRPQPAPAPVFARFPEWMWRNREVEAFLHWLRAHNGRQAIDLRVEFRGLDIYSLGASIAAVLRYLDRADPPAAAAARRRYGCLTPWQEEPADYGRNVLHGGGDCEAAVVAQLRELLDQRLRYLAHDGEDFFDAAQNARVVQAAENYYRIMWRGSRESWNLRDRHMFDTLERLLQRRGAAAKAVVWAHNSHLGDAAATDMGRRGELNLGQLCRQRWGRQAVLIGQGTDRGTVLAADDWGALGLVKDVRPCREDSWERVWLEAAPPRSLTQWRDDARLRAALGEERLQRAIGVIYRPHTELHSHYFAAVLAEQFDAWLWFAETRALSPLPAPPADSGTPDLWPFGV